MTSKDLEELFENKELLLRVLVANKIFKINEKYFKKTKIEDLKLQAGIATEEDVKNILKDICEKNKWNCKTSFGYEVINFNDMKEAEIEIEDGYLSISFFIIKKNYKHFKQDSIGFDKQDRIKSKSHIKLFGDCKNVIEKTLKKISKIAK